EEERVVDWTYGKVRQALYPLEHIDSIHPGKGKINRNSALALAVYGETDDHLLLLPGLLEKLVHRKWTTYGRKTLYKQFFWYVLYFLSIMVCFMMRPTPFERNEDKNDLICLLELGDIHWSQLSSFTYAYHILNVVSTIGAALYIYQLHSHIRNVGWNMYFLSLSGFPAKVIFLISCFLTVFNFSLRLFCFDEIEDIVWIIIVQLTAIKFLFFCRGFKAVGPFVLMLYKIILRDLIRFLLIYLVIVIGFSQAFYIIFLGYKREGSKDEQKESIMRNVPESYVRMFIMSLTEFATFFEQLEDCELTVLGKIMFVIYMLLVTILLINMLIASMTNTYQQAKYSTPMEDGKGIALLLKTRMDDQEYDEECSGWRHRRKKFREELRRKRVATAASAIHVPNLHFFTPRGSINTVPKSAR
ncbi:hypothetical protein PMAYCL1PPCAC_17849, partial [Pristionchus mayeri]